MELNIKHQVTDALSHLSWSGVAASPLEDDVLRLMMSETPPKEAKTKTDTNIWHSIP